MLKLKDHTETEWMKKFENEVCGISPVKWQPSHNSKFHFKLASKLHNQILFKSLVIGAINCFIFVPNIKRSPNANTVFSNRGRSRKYTHLVISSLDLFSHDACHELDSTLLNNRLFGIKLLSTFFRF